MSNLNINRNIPDTGDNVRYSHNTPRTDYKGITLLLVGIIGALTVVWLVILLIARLGCYIDGAYDCSATAYIFWGYVILLALTLAPMLAIAVKIVWERSLNMPYLQWRGVLTHRDDARRMAPEIIGVAAISAHSEAWAGLDTFSPSTTEVKKPELKVVAEPTMLEGGDDSSLAPISLGDL